MSKTIGQKITDQVNNIIDEKGREVNTAPPAAMPVGFHRPPSLQEQIRKLVRDQMSQYAANRGAETFEEADDFNVGDDDFDPRSPYEENFDHEANLEKDFEPIRLRHEAAIKAAEAAKAPKKSKKVKPQLDESDEEDED